MRCKFLLQWFCALYCMHCTFGADESKENEQEMRNIVYIGIVIVSILVGISIAFEIATDKLLEETDELNMPFVNTIFSELTTLGFIGLILFVLSKLELLSQLSLEYLGEKERLQELIEELHMVLFMFVLIFLTLCCGLLKFGMHVQREWRVFERRVSDIPTVVSDYALAIEELKSWKNWFSIAKVRNLHARKREMAYLSLRKRFVDPNAAKHNKLLNQQVLEYQNDADIRFPFNEYLAIISGEVMGRLIQIDVLTWLALETIIVAFWIVCWQLGPEVERMIMLGAGFMLIVLNQYVYIKIYEMRHQLTPSILYKEAKILRARKAWCDANDIPMTERDGFAHEDLCEDDYVPAFVKSLPYRGANLTAKELNVAQKALLGGKGNGVLLALFSTRMVFLLTAMHLSVFLARGASDIYKSYSGMTIVVFYFMMILPSLLVTYMATRIARDGLYAFNVEYMKVPRVITKVLVLLKARRTLRTLRFVAEMKVYLREDERRNSTIVQLKDVEKAIQNANKINYVLSPRTATMIERTDSFRKRQADAYELEQERREISTIFNLFDSDESGSISRQEMKSLLQGITHDMSDDQVQRIMNELDSEHHGEVWFEDFYNWCHERIHACNHSTAELIQEVFNMVDTDHSGEITVDEFMAIFKCLGQSLDQDDVRELVYQMDSNDDGKINLAEFSKTLRKHAI